MDVFVELLKQFGVIVALLGINLYFTYKLYVKFKDIETSLMLGDQRMNTLQEKIDSHESECEKHRETQSASRKEFYTRLGEVEKGVGILLDRIPSKK